MKKIKEFVSSLFTIILILAVGFAGGCYFWMNKMETEAETEVVMDDNAKIDIKLPTEQEKRIITKEEIEAKLVEIGELATYSGEYTVEHTEEEYRDLLDRFRIPGTKNLIALKCEGVVKVGYDVKDIGVQVDNESMKIYLTFPKQAEILDNYIVWDTVECDEKDCWNNPIEFVQYKAMLTELEAKGLVQVEEKGIYKAAEDNFKSIIETFFYGFEDYELIFI